MQYEEYDQYNNAKSIILKLIRSNISQTDGVVTDEVDTNNTDTVMSNIVTLLNTTMSDLYQAVLTIGETPDKTGTTTVPIPSSRPVFWYAYVKTTNTYEHIPDIMSFTGDLKKTQIYVFDSAGTSVYHYIGSTKIKKDLVTAKTTGNASLLADVENMVIAQDLGYEMATPVKTGTGLYGGAKVTTFRSTNLYITFMNLIYNSSVSLKQANKLFTDIETSIQFIEPDTLEEFNTTYSDLEELYLNFLKTTYKEDKFKVSAIDRANPAEKAKLQQTLKSIMDEFDTLNANKTYLDQHYNYAGNLNTIGASRSNGQSSSSSRQTATYYDEE